MFFFYFCWVVFYLFFFLCFLFFFFFSSRRRHTRSLCDWSSDVCSSDLLLEAAAQRGPLSGRRLQQHPAVSALRREHAIQRLGHVAEPTRLVRVRARVQEIGRASCRERVYISVVAVSLKKK